MKTEYKKEGIVINGSFSNDIIVSDWYFIKRNSGILFCDFIHSVCDGTYGNKYTKCVGITVWATGDKVIYGNMDLKRHCLVCGCLRIGIIPKVKAVFYRKGMHYEKIDFFLRTNKVRRKMFYISNVLF